MPNPQITTRHYITFYGANEVSATFEVPSPNSFPEIDGRPRWECGIPAWSEIYQRHDVDETIIGGETFRTDPIRQKRFKLTEGERVELIAKIEATKMVSRRIPALPRMR